MTTLDELQARIAQLQDEHTTSATLLQITRDLNSTRNSEELLHAMAQYASKMGAQMALLLYVQDYQGPEPEWAKLVAIWPQDAKSPLPDTRLHIPESPIGRLWFARQNETCFLPDIDHDPQIDRDSVRWLSDMDTRALVTVPLSHIGRWIGLVSFHWNQPHEFSAEEAATYRALHSLASPVVANHQLLDKLEETVGDRRRAEMTLLEERNLLRTVVDNVPDFIYVKDLQSRILLNNVAHAQAIGATSPKEVIGKTDFDFAPAQLAAGYVENDQIVIRTGRSFAQEEPYVDRKTDKQGWLFTSKIPLRDTDGQLVGLVGICHDITEQKRLEAGRERQRQLLKALMDALPDILLLKDQDSVFLACSKEYCALLGRSADEIVGKTDFDLFPREDAQRYREEEISVMQTGQTVVAEHLLETTRGARYFETIKVPLRDEQDNVFGLLSTERDITARKLAEQALAAEKERLDVTLRSIGDGVITTDTEGVITLINQIAQELTGWSQSEAVGKPLTEVFRVLREDTQEPEESPVDRVLQTEQIVTLANHTILVARDGRQRIIADSGAPIRGANGRVLGVVLVFRDITRQEELEEKARREQMQQQVIDAQRHALQELSTPIIPIMDRIIVMPLIGSIDTLRAKDIMRSLLAGISRYQAKIVILDITGVPFVDSGVAAHLNKTIQAARLKGARTIVTGISDAVAETVVDLAIDWSGIETLDNMQTGLLTALHSLGIKLTK